jgi:hypothetical protein
LVKLATNRQFRRWLVTLGPVAAKSFSNFLAQMRHRESAIRQANEIDGHFSVATIDGERHVVVWKDGKPFSAFPPVTGDLAEKLSLYNQKLLKRPDDLARRRARRWAEERARNTRRRREPPGTEEWTHPSSRRPTR